MAERYLLDRGLTFRQRNHHCRQGEVDLIMNDGETLVFVEVRFRRSARFGTAAETVTTAKQHKLHLAAQDFLMRHPALQRRPIRFDVVAIMPEAGTGYRYDWVPSAFGN